VQHEPRDASVGEAGTTGSWEAEHAARERAEAEASRLGRLQNLTAGLSRARTPNEVAEVALDAGVAALGGARGFVLVAGMRGELDVLRCARMREEPARLAASTAVPGPTIDAFLTGRPVFVEGPAELRARYPGLAPAAEVFDGAVAALPLVVEGHPRGVLAVAFDGPRTFADADRSLAETMASHCAQALERARLFVAERVARTEAVAARRRLAFLDALSAHLAEAADEREILEGVVLLSVPALGDWVGIFLSTESSALARTAEQGPAALGAAVEAHLRGDAAERVERARGRGEVVFVNDFPPDPSGAQPPSAAFVPLSVRGRQLGLLAVASAESRLAADTADLSLAADVAHRTAVALEHARLLEAATLAARAREEFLHVASHELRGPLGTLRLTVQLLRRHARSGNLQAYEERLRVLERQAQRLVRLSETLLDVSRITAGRLELMKEEGDVAGLVRDVAARFVEDAAEKGSVLVVDAPGPLRCTFDPARLDQIVSNLVSNAVKYGGGAEIAVRVRGAEGRARIEVEDHGIGIAPDQQERIFGRFERAVSGRRYGGLGLGLWIARRLVEAHGGVVRVRSAPGVGSTFTVELPLDPATRA
jgi:signal transduction histidine kinase